MKQQEMQQQQQMQQEQSLAAINLRQGNRFFRLSDIAKIRRAYAAPPAPPADHVQPKTGGAGWLVAGVQALQ